jgi:hypothetical protein
MPIRTIRSDSGRLSSSKNGLPRRQGKVFRRGSATQISTDECRFGSWPVAAIRAPGNMRYKRTSAAGSNLSVNRSNIACQLHQQFDWAPRPLAPVESRTGAVVLRSLLVCIQGFPVRARLGVSVTPFPAPATSHVACGFPALRAPAHFTSRVMWPWTSCLRLEV